jgi:hypothetical protein
VYADIRLLDKFFSFADTALVSISILEVDALDRQRYESRLLAVGIVFVGARGRSRRAIYTRAFAPAEPAISFLLLAITDVQRLNGRRVGVVAVHFVGADEVD